MTDTRERQGQCLCGDVKVTATKSSNSVGACHCSICRTWVGGPYLAIDCGTDVAFEGEDHVGIYNLSDWAERGFCRNCGTALFYRLKESGQLIMSAGLFEGEGGLVLDHEVFVDEQPAYYGFSNKTERKTGAELFAEFGAEP